MRTRALAWPVVFSLLLLLFSSCVALTPAAVENSSRQPGLHRATVGDMQLDWRVDDGATLYIRLSAPTTGWIGIGFEPMAALKDADIITGFVSNGTVSIVDGFGTYAFWHEPDVDLGGSNDVIDATGGEDRGWTTLSFRIPLDSGDSMDHVLVPEEMTTIVLAYGPRDTHLGLYTRFYKTQLPL